MSQDCRLFWKLSFCLFDPFWPGGSFKIFIASVWFHKVPCYVTSQEHHKLLQLPWKKCIKIAVSFENSPFCFIGPFLVLCDIPGSFFEVFIVSVLFHKVPWQLIVSPIIFFNCIKTAVFIENDLFVYCRPFWTFLTSSLESSWSLISSMRYLEI